MNHFISITLGIKDKNIKFSEKVETKNTVAKMLYFIMES